LGLGLTLFQGWQGYVEQGLYWSPEPKIVAADLALEYIHQRLIEVEASQAAIHA